jgi:Cdc6-like AAA superfamily ATPase
VVLYGDRGVGKTSLSNVLVEFLRDVGQDTFVVRVNCDVSDNYGSLWTKALRNVKLSIIRDSIGFTATPVQTTENALDLLPEQIAPDDVRLALEILSKDLNLVIIFDEFDRMRDKLSTTLMADTIKTLSDNAVDATILLIGVADSVDALIGEHQSIERALVQVKLPRMSQAEVEQIVKKGMSKLGLSATRDCLSEITSLSQGLPYVTHLLALHTSRAACSRRSILLTLDDVHRAVLTSVGQWQQSVITTYHKATLSHQPEHLYKEVLAACALAIPDTVGYFTAASVRDALRIITGRACEISKFSRHLTQFTKAERGAVLQQTGASRKVRFRFESPLVKTYIIMRSVADGRISRAMMEQIEAGL